MGPDNGAKKGTNNHINPGPVEGIPDRLVSLSNKLQHKITAYEANGSVANRKAFSEAQAEFLAAEKAEFAQANHSERAVLWKWYAALNLYPTAKQETSPEIPERLIALQGALEAAEADQGGGAAVWTAKEARRVAVEEEVNKAETYRKKMQLYRWYKLKKTAARPAPAGKAVDHVNPGRWEVPERLDRLKKSYQDAVVRKRRNKKVIFGEDAFDRQVVRTRKALVKMFVKTYREHHDQAAVLKKWVKATKGYTDLYAELQKQGLKGLQLTPPGKKEEGARKAKKADKQAAPTSARGTAAQDKGQLSAGATEC